MLFDKGWILLAQNGASKLVYAGMPINNSEEFLDGVEIVTSNDKTFKIHDFLCRELMQEDRPMCRKHIFINHLNRVNHCWGSGSLDTPSWAYRRALFSGISTC
jgi:hypothetical protein